MAIRSAILVFFTGWFLLAASASAQPPGREGGERRRGGNTAELLTERILAQDKDDDRKISKRELPRHLHTAFDAADEDGNGMIDSKEFVQGSLKTPFIFKMLCPKS